MLASRPFRSRRNEYEKKKRNEYGFGQYKPCSLHSNNLIKSQCAKVKSLMLYEWCLQKFHD
jgi:hypothetical protein